MLKFLLKIFFLISKFVKLFRKLRNNFICSINDFPHNTSIGNYVNFYGKKHISLDSGICFNRGCIIEAWDNYRGYKYTPVIRIGKNCSFGEYTHITCCNRIIIGENVLTGRFVLIADNSHGDFNNINMPPRERPLFSKGPIVINDNVWIGDRVSILGGVSIGENSIVATGAIVTKDVPANSLVAGCPAKIIKQK